MSSHYWEWNVLQQEDLILWKETQLEVTLDTPPPLHISHIPQYPGVPSLRVHITMYVDIRSAGCHALSTIFTISVGSITLIQYSNEMFCKWCNLVIRTTIKGQQGQHDKSLMAKDLPKQWQRVATTTQRQWLPPDTGVREQQDEPHHRISCPGFQLARRILSHHTQKKKIRLRWMAFSVSCSGATHPIDHLQ